MGLAKYIRIKPISSKDANAIIKALHYSGKVVSNSQIHLGVFLEGRCGGALQFGPSLDKRKMLGLVAGTKWNDFIELNRMALADWLPRNSESRSIAAAMRILRRQYPWLQWVVSFADGCQCGDGAIYRASGFILTGIKPNNQMWRSPGSSDVFSSMSLTDGRSKRQQRKATAVVSRTTCTKGKHILNSGASSMSAFKAAGWRPIPGYQMRYIYFLDQAAKGRLTVPIIPFSEIARRGAEMYKGSPCVRSVDSDTPANQAGEGGANPTRTLFTHTRKKA